MVLACILLKTRLSVFPVILVVSSATKHLLLLRTSTPVTSHCVGRHSDLIGDSIAVILRLSMTRIECPSNQTWMTREYIRIIYTIKANCNL